MKSRFQRVLQHGFKIALSILVAQMLMMGSAFAFDEMIEDDTVNRRFLEVTERAINLELMMFPDGAARLDPAYPMQDERVQSATFQLVQGTARVWYKSLCKECGPQPMSEEDMLQELAPATERPTIIGHFTQRLHDKLLESSVDLVATTADLGARYGRTLVIAKTAAELVEFAGSFLLGMKGIHLFCNAIDVALISWARGFQIPFRTIAMAEKFDRNGGLALMQRMAVAHRVNKIFRQSQILMGPLDVDADLLKIVDQRGPKNRTSNLHRFARIGRRAEFVQWVDQKLQKQPEQNVNFGITRKEFMGKRYGLTLGIFARRSKFMADRSDDPVSEILENKQLWVVGFQEGVVNAIDRRTQRQEPLTSDEIRTNRPLNDVYQSLLDEFSSSNNLSDDQTNTLRALLEQIDAIFNTEKSVDERYYLAGGIETFFKSFIYPFMKTKWLTQYKNQSRFSNLWHTFRELTAKGKFIQLTTKFADFLSVAAMSDSESMEELKYASGNYFLEIIAHMQVLKEFEAKKATLSDIKLSLRELKDAGPWVHRATRRRAGWFPMGRYVRCEDI